MRWKKEVCEKETAITIKDVLIFLIIFRIYEAGLRIKNNFKAVIAKIKSTYLKLRKRW